MTSQGEENRFFTVSLFESGDGQGVADLFRKVYGEAYPIKLVYDSEALACAFEARENIPVVARTADGKVIAYQALYRSAPNSSVYEAGQGLVHPDFRGRGINSEISRYMRDTLIPDLGAESIFGEAVCNHTHMQKTWGGLGNIETALEVDLMPSEAYAAEGSASGRVSTLFMCTVEERKPSLVHLPAPYVEPLRYLYEGIGDRRDFRIGDGSFSGVDTEMAVQVFDFAGVARVTVNQAGEDFENLLTTKEAELLEKRVVVLQVWLKLSWPFIDKVVGMLRDRGYFLGGLLPRWFAGSDGILMQKLVEQPNWEGIHPYSERAVRILQLVKRDWEERCPT
jgi:hypothetical protein